MKAKEELIKEDWSKYSLPKNENNEVISNDGWVRVDGEDDLPMELLWLYKSFNKDLYLGRFYDDSGFPINRLATHYQQIQKPKPPIF